MQEKHSSIRCSALRCSYIHKVAHSRYQISDRENVRDVKCLLSHEAKLYLGFYLGGDESHQLKAKYNCMIENEGCYCKWKTCMSVGTKSSKLMSRFTSWNATTYKKMWIFSTAVRISGTLEWFCSYLCLFFWLVCRQKFHITFT